MEVQYPIEVSPEGMLLIPSVGAVDVSGLRLAEVQRRVEDAAASAYEKSEVSLTLEALRFFRVHVVGEVEYPGTYVAQAVDRVSDLIADAGGVSERAWKREVEVRHPDGTMDIFDLDAFETSAELIGNRYVNGGDVIHVPSIGIGVNLVEVEGDLLNSGTYRIYPDENLLMFLQRIRVLKRNTDLSKIIVVRSSAETQRFIPFSESGVPDMDFRLQAGDHVVIPTNYVYVKGAVRSPGAYPFVLNLTAKDYAGMAGGDYRSGKIRACRVYHVRTGRTEKGPDVFVEAGDVVHLKSALNFRVREYVQLFTALTSLFLAANAAGLFE
jgi:protein involved in polysaccharide export with SLBB domain